MTVKLRIDRHPLAAPVTATIFEGRVARTHVPGDALVYASGPEHRDVSEIENIVQQLPQLKVYLGHPVVFPSSKSGQQPIGYVENGRLDEDAAVARIVITDAKALEMIQSGTKELSLGYQCKLDDGRYQRGIKLDHLAVVDRARCSAQCALRTDALTVEVAHAEENMIEVPVTITVSEETKALVEQPDALQAKQDCGDGNAPDGKVQERSDTCACKNHAIVHNNGEPMSDLNNELQGKLDAALAEIEVLKGKVTTLEVESVNARKDAEAANGQLEAVKAEVVQAKADADAALAQAKTDAADALKGEVDARVAARVGLIVEASRFDMKDVDLAKLSDREIKCAVIKHVDGDEVPADKPELFVDGVYSGAVKRGLAATTSRESVRTAVTEMRKDGAAKVATSGKSAEQAAKESMKRASESAWMKTE